MPRHITEQDRDFIWSDSVNRAVPRWVVANGVRFVWDER